MPTCIYGCQRVRRNADGKLEHAPPIVVIDGEQVAYVHEVEVQGPSELITQPDNRPPEVASCKDHSHTIWLQTESQAIEYEQPLRSDKSKRVYVCAVAAKDPENYPHGAIVFEQGDIGQTVARHIRFTGPCRVIFDEKHPVSGFCPCRTEHPHRMWIETDDPIEVIE